jgi:tRNA(Ile)-lysidine synthetase-like protein
MTPSIKNLQYLVALKKTNHFSNAAKECFVSASTFSAGISKLENDLQVKLVERDNKNVRFTSAGNRVTQQAESVLAEMNVLVSTSKIDFFESEITIGVIPTISTYILPTFLSNITQFKRNLLRVELIPKLKNSFESMIKNISRSAAHQAEALTLLHDLAEIDIARFNLIVDNKIQINHLIKLSSERITNVLRFYINQRGFLMPSNKVLDELLTVMSAKSDAQVLLKWHCYEVRRYNGELYFFDTEHEGVKLQCPYYKKLQHLSNLEVRFRKDGQRVKLKGKDHSSSLKKVLQESNIPPWERDKLRMYYVDGHLIAMESIGEMSEVLTNV